MGPRYSGQILLIWLMKRHVSIAADDHQPGSPQAQTLGPLMPNQCLVQAPIAPQRDGL